MNSVANQPQSSTAAKGRLEMATKDDSSDSLRFNRRNFLRTTGLVGLAETIAAPVELAAQSTPAAVGPGDVPVRLNVNGRQHRGWSCRRRPVASRAAGLLRQGRADVRLLHAGLHHGERSLA